MKPIFVYFFFSLLGCSQLMAQPEYERLLPKFYAQRICQLKISIEKVIVETTGSASAFQQLAYCCKDHKSDHSTFINSLKGVIYKAGVTGILTSQASEYVRPADKTTGP